MQLQQVLPPATGNGISQVHGPHIALHDPKVPSRHQLLFMIEGTGSSAMDCRSFDSSFASMGFHVVSIDYPNNVNTVTCRTSNDSSCFDLFRQEIVFGTPVSDKVAVDSLNSIVYRLTRLLIYLAANDRTGQWGEFLLGDHPNWRKIVVAGHSQGAGHAAFLGKSFQLAGVLMFSGPQDYLENFRRPAPWQSRTGQTPVSRYYAFLHVKDPYNFNYQVADVAAAAQLSINDTVMVSPNSPVNSTKHILVNRIETRDPHGSTLLPIFLPAWRYMVEKL